jgi:hypothetical protein
VLASAALRRDLGSSSNLSATRGHVGTTLTVTARGQVTFRKDALQHLPIPI